MKFSWAVNLHDSDGDVYEECVVAFIGDETIIRFKTMDELEDFAKAILHALPEIRHSID